MKKSYNSLLGFKISLWGTCLLQYKGVENYILVAKNVIPCLTRNLITIFSTRFDEGGHISLNVPQAPEELVTALDISDTMIHDVMNL